MAINVTPIPRLTVLAAPAFTLGTANAAGDAITAVASNSTILTYDASNPSNVAAAPVVGTASTAARRDHVHVGGPAATEAQMVAASDDTVFATPGRTQYHPGVAKAYGNADADGTLTAGSVNITSSAKDATGDYTWTFDTDFANANYTTQVTHEAQAVNNATISIDSIATGTIGVNIWAADASNTRADDGNQITAFGLQ